MAYYSKYSGKEVDERLDRVDSIPTKISQLLNDKDYITEIELKAILDKIPIVDFSKIPIDEDTIYWSENSDGKLVLKSKGGGEDSNWSVKKDSNGNKYIYTELPVVTQYGVTMYGNSGDINLPSLYAGLPIDNQTIYWDNGVLKSLGGGGEGLDEEALRNYLLINGYATESWVLNLGYIGPEGLKNYVDISSNQDINGKKNFKSGISINGLDIYQSQDDVIYLDANLVVRGGITMFSDGEDVDIPSIAQGLPFDNRTIWYNPETNQIEVIGGTGGGSGEGVSNFWDLSGIPSWITNSKPKYTYSEIESTPDLSVFATQNWIISQDYVSAEELKKYIPISGYTEVSGEKNFTGGLKVNDSLIHYDKDKKYWKLEGDLLVTGGVTMYGSDSSFTPSTIMDALLYDDTTLGINSNGQLYVKGGTGGGGLDITALQNYLTQNSYLNVTGGDNRYLKLSGGTITGELHVSSTSTNRAIIRLFSAADVPNDLLFGTNGEYHWSITSRNIEEGRYIGLYNNKEGSNGWVFKANYDTRVLDFMNTPTVNGNTIWHSDNDGSGSGLDADLLDGKHLSEIIRYEGYSNKNANKADTPQTITYWAENGGYGSTYGTALNIQGAGSWNNRIAFRTDGKIDYYQGINTGDMSYIGQLAFTSSNVASATKLQTARTIWGQSFDGTGNVDGVLTINKATTSSGDYGACVLINGNYAETGFHRALSYENQKMVVGSTAAMYVGAKNTQYNGGFLGFKYVSANSSSNYMSIGLYAANDLLCVLGNGNVGIGTPNPSAKFQVNGNAAIYSSSAGVISLYRTVSDGGSYVDYYPLNQTSQKWRVGAGSVDEFFYEAADGSNLARICHHATKGTRLEVGKRFLSVQPSGSDADRSVITLISNGDSPTDFIMGSGNYAWSITSRNSAEGHLLGFYSALSGQYAMRVYKEGNVLVTGGITMYSDQRKKTILNHVELSLKQIADAPLIEHYYNSDESKTTHVGSIAQYWASMNDWFCKLDSEGYYTMEIQNAALASAISIARELDRYETKTDKAIKKLKKRICELEEEVERLKSA